MYICPANESAGQLSGIIKVHWLAYLCAVQHCKSQICTAKIQNITNSSTYINFSLIDIINYHHT